MNGVENGEALTSIFGYWPSFHDAEVHSLTLDRNDSEPSASPSLEAVIHVFEMTDRVNDKNFFICRHHTLVRMKFFCIDNLQLDNFNCQNSLSELAISDISDRQLETIKFEVDFLASWGVSCKFVCRTISILSAEPFVPLGS